MGLFDSVSGAVKKGLGSVKKGVKSVTSNPLGVLNPVLGTQLYMGEKGMGQLFGGSQPQAPGMDANLKALKKQQVSYAKQFRESLPQIQQQMMGQLQSDTQKNLMENLRQSRSGASARGLLYGGIQQGNEASQRQQAARGLMSGASNINLGLQQAADQMDTSAIKAGVNMQAQQQALQNMIYQNAMAQQAGQNQILGSAMSAGAMAAMLSDERAKECIKPCDDEIKDMLNELNAVEYFYKNMASLNYGIIAQDLEKTKAGSSVVIENENNYKMIDVAKATGLVLASLAHLNKRLKQLEDRYGSI